MGGQCTPRERGGDQCRFTNIITIRYGVRTSHGVCTRLAFALAPGDWHCRMHHHLDQAQDADGHHQPEADAVSGCLGMSEGRCGSGNGNRRAARLKRFAVWVRGLGAGCLQVKGSDRGGEGGHGRAAGSCDEQRQRQ